MVQVGFVLSKVLVCDGAVGGCVVWWFDVGGGEVLDRGQ